MTIFQTYFDETGIEATDGTMRWIGLMGHHRFWPKFDKKWSEILCEEPKIRYWHTTSAHNGQLNIHEDERRQKEDRFSKLIGDSHKEIFGIIIELQLKLVSEHVKGKTTVSKIQKKLAPGLRPYLEHPTFIAMRWAIKETIELGIQGNNLITPGDPLQVWTIFEQNESLADFQDDMCFSMQVLRRQLSPQLRTIVGPVIFVQGKGPLAQTTLQAADLYAWHIQRMSKTDNTQPGWEHLKRIPSKRVQITADDLKQMVSALNKGERMEI